MACSTRNIYVKYWIKLWRHWSFSYQSQSIKNWMFLQFLFRSTEKDRKRILPKEDIVLLILRSRFLPGNVVIIASTLCPRLRPLPATPTNVFLGGLATADLVLIIFCIPVKVSNKTRDLAGSCFSVEVLWNDECRFRRSNNYNDDFLFMIWWFFSILQMLPQSCVY